MCTHPPYNTQVYGPEGIDVDCAYTVQSVPEPEGEGLPRRESTGIQSQPLRSPWRWAMKGA